jgi:hypothetical protein
MIKIRVFKYIKPEPYFYRVLVSFVLYLLQSTVYSQNIKTWHIGDHYPNLSPNQPDTGEYKFSGMNNISFNPFNNTRTFKSLSLSWNVINMPDNNGNLLFYSNGSKVFNSQHQLIEKADSLNYSNYWANSAESGYYADYLIGSYANSLMAFRSPSNSNQYYLVSTIMNYDNLAQTQWLRFHKVVYSIIDMSLNNGKGKMIVKEQNLLSGDFSHAISACKHANGRDWWITARGYQDTNCYYFFKLDDKGIIYDHKQCIGVNYTIKYPGNLTLSYGQNYSHDGKQFSILSYKGLELFDFDRCKGLFSNPRYASYPFNDDDKLYSWFQTASVCFSPNSRYLYAIVAGIKNGSNLDKLYQFDTKVSDFKNSQETIAVYDGFKDKFEDSSAGGWATTFYTLQLTPDNRIFMGTGLPNRYLHTIDSPDNKSVACAVKQHAIKLLTSKAGLPYYPNYNLGAATDTCVGSGITETEALDIIVYPNPASDFVEVFCQKWTVGGGVELYNLLGQQVFPTIELSKDGFRLDIRDLSEGIYLLQLRDKTGSAIKTEKLVIAR